MERLRALARSFAFPVVMIVLSVAYLYGAAQIRSLQVGDPLGPKAFPYLVGGAMLITSGLLILNNLRRKRQTLRQSLPDSDKGYIVVVAVAAWTAIYFLVFEPLGYMVATAFYLFPLMVTFYRGKWATSLLVSVLFALSSYLLFSKMLGVTLAPGVLAM